MRIIQPDTPEQLEAFRGLLREWFDFLVNDCGRNEFFMRRRHP